MLKIQKFILVDIPLDNFRAEQITVKDSKGMRLYAELMEIMSGANDMSFDKNLAVSNPPRFLLYH